LDIGAGSADTGLVGAPEELLAEFTPLGRADRARRILLFAFGPLLWLAAVVVVGVVVHRTKVVELGLLITLVAFVCSLPLSLVARRLRLRDEREAAERS
jgi:hypothetical protein